MMMIKHYKTPMIWILSSIMFMGIITVSPIQGTSSLLAEGYYKNGNYSGALTEFQALSKAYPNNPDILYNLGNTYYKLGKLGHAIFYYKQAQQLTPRDSQLADNLNLARSKVVDQVKNKQPFLVNQFHEFLHSFSLNEALLLFLFLFMILNGVIWVKKQGSKKELIGNLVILFSVIFILYGLVFIAKFRDELAVKSGVVTSKKVEVKAGPSSTLTTLFFLHEGVEFLIIKDLSEWVEIKLTNGFTGWLQVGAYSSE